MNRLNVGKLVVRALFILWTNRRAFAKALFVPFLLIVGLTLAWDYLVGHIPPAGKWGLHILHTALFVVIAVTCHRLVLLDARENAIQYKINWTTRETRFIGWAIGLLCIFGVVVFLVTLPLVALKELLIEPYSTWSRWALLGAQVPALYVFARCSVVFPAIAINRQVNLKWAWNLSKNNGWRLLMLVLVLPWLISHAIGFLYRDNATFIETTVLTFLGFAFVAVEIAALSLAYRELIQGERNDILEPDLSLEPEAYSR